MARIVPRRLPLASFRLEKADEKTEPGASGRPCPRCPSPAGWKKKYVETQSFQECAFPSRSLGTSRLRGDRRMPASLDRAASGKPPDAHVAGVPAAYTLMLLILAPIPTVVKAQWERACPASAAGARTHTGCGQHAVPENSGRTQCTWIRRRRRLSLAFVPLPPSSCLNSRGF